MPGFDGTGPRGMGPMTGGGRGRCNPARGGVPSAAPFGGFGGRGRGHRWMYYATGLPGWMRFGGYPAAPTAMAAGPAPGQQLETLRAQAEALQGQLDAIGARIADLEQEG